jgi:hypothetical protein
MVSELFFRQVSWLAGYNACSAFPALTHQWHEEQTLAAYSCGGSSGIEK